jgi:hypothetical protein
MPRYLLSIINFQPSQRCEICNVTGNLTNGVYGRWTKKSAFRNKRSILAFLARMSVLYVRYLGFGMRCQQCYDCANDNNESSRVPVD